MGWQPYNGGAKGSPINLEAVTATEATTILAAVPTATPTRTNTPTATLTSTPTLTRGTWMPLIFK